MEAFVQTGPRRDLQPTWSSFKALPSPAGFHAKTEEGARWDGSSLR